MVANHKKKCGLDRELQSDLELDRERQRDVDCHRKRRGMGAAALLGNPALIGEQTYATWS